MPGELSRGHGSQARNSLLWALGFTVFIWAGARVLGLQQLRAVLFALVCGACIWALVHFRGAELDEAAGEEQERPQPAPYQPYAGKTRELVQARAELELGNREEARFLLREAEKVARAQGKPEVLREARELERGLRIPVGEDVAAAATTPELRWTLSALARGDGAAALFSLDQARRVAVAQRQRARLSEVYALAQALSEQSEGRTRAAAERLVRRTRADIRSF